MLTIYNKVISAANKNPDHDFSHGERGVRAFLIPITVIRIDHWLKRRKANR